MDLNKYLMGLGLFSGLGSAVAGFNESLVNVNDTIKGEDIPARFIDVTYSTFSQDLTRFSSSLGSWFFMLIFIVILILIVMAFKKGLFGR